MTHFARFKQKERGEKFSRKASPNRRRRKCGSGVDEKGRSRNFRREKRRGEAILEQIR
ncbi:hypothetical protein BJY01DRAFT_223724 [Aspergillus pseudoustus]|uniref:Uncharacterized protein n=1 Tax=Aspergillus pseudoustus TaxID=1810923 RepID=A0ABR4J624_9EURO